MTLHGGQATQALPFLDNVPGAPAPTNGYWQREGSCDQCAHGDVRGECCTKVALPITPTAGRNPEIVKYFKLHGIEVKWWGDLPLAFVPMRCEALLPNGDCSLFGLPERPEVCLDTPLNPWASKALPHCSYEFKWVPNEGETNA